MAQTGYTPIQIYSSSTSGNTPSATNLSNNTSGSELAININDGKLFYKDSAGVVQVIAWKTTPTTAGGTGLTSYTVGDLMYYATGNTLSKLPIGAANTVLTSSGTAPQWSNNLNIGSLTATSLNTSGNLAFTGTGNRITGDFSNTTQTNRIFFQSSTTNGNTFVSAIPNGTSANAIFQAYNNSDPTNASTFRIQAGSASVLLQSGITGTGTYLPIEVQAGGSTRATFFTNGDVSIGTASDGYKLRVAGDAFVETGSIFLSNGYGVGWGNTYISGANTANLTITTNGTEKARFFPSGGVSIGNTTDPGASNLSVSGNVVIGTSGKGMDFSATPGTGTSELLDDYEEGTWTPTQGAGLTVVGTFASTGTYTKVGRMVTIRGQVSATTSVACAAAGVLTGGFPFAPATVSSGTAINNDVNGSAITYITTSSTMLAGQAIAAAGVIVFSTTYFV